MNIINPSSGEIIREFALATSDEVKAIIAKARQAFDQGPWPRLSLTERKQFILKIGQGILDKAAELAEIETLNTGKPIKETTFMDIPSAAKAFEFMANNLEKYLASETLDIEGQAQARLAREPMGVVALIIPWNYPLLIACWKLASALAAGNTVILKPSSLTPLSALELNKIIKNAGLPEGVVNLVFSGGEIFGKAVCGDKAVDMVSFTGSNEVGKQILEYSGGSVKKLIMELGGKSASVIFPDADFDVAVNSALTSIFLNQGQMCTAMSRILVQEEIYERFAKEFAARAQRIKLGPGLDFETQMGPLISEGQRQKLIVAIEKAKQSGAKLLCGGKIPDNSQLKRGFFFEPTVLAQATPQMSIFREEAFGPVAVLSKFSTAQEAINLANDSDFGLAASIWTSDQNLAQSTAAKINAGTIWINTYGMFYNQLPFGGFKQSGFGKELGREGFLEYTRLKNIITDQSAEGKPLVNFWYGF